MCRRNVDIQDHFPPDHEVREFLRIGLRGRHLARDLARAKHRHVIGEGHHLFEFVRDEDDRLAFIAKLLQVAKQLVGFLRREDRGGLIQNENFRVAIQQLQDFDSLLHAHGKLLDG